MPSPKRSSARQNLRGNLVVAAVTGVILGVGALILQRWVADTRTAAIVMVAAWYGAVGLGAVVAVFIRSRARWAALATWVAVAIGTVAIGYWTGFRDRRVDEDVVIAQARASAPVRAEALAGESPGAAGARNGADGGRPVSIARGTFTGQDGHAGTGVATVVADARGQRTLTFTRFDVDPGVDVLVYLTPTTENVDDGVELGGLKGNIGDQQYVIPPDVDLAKYDSVVVWCRPFTVRIATAELS
jgi:hypothetical protein